LFDATKVAAMKLSPITIAIIGAAMVVMCVMIGHYGGRALVLDDCARLNMTVINGHIITCRPHNPNPRKVM
jgi:hypothetical protein